MSEMFGPYQFIRKIAQGGMAEVFLASRQGEIGGFTKQVAIKRIYQHLAEDPELITMFFDEARIAAQLNHPNIVQIYDLGQIDGFFYIAMEFIHGRDLRSICERGIQVSNFLPIPTAVKVVAEAAAGLNYAHAKADGGSPLNIVHRDVSPQNILVSMNGGVKVCDFGIAKAEERLTHTRTGQFKGKFSYMSPEQVIGDGRRIDMRSDIFSLGIVLYEITVCTRLFRGKNDYDTIRMVAESDVARPTQVRDGFPPELERIIMKALAREPSQRYQTAEEMQVDLEEWLVEQRAKTSPVHIARYMAQLFPEFVEKPGGISEDMTVERDISSLVSSGFNPARSAPAPEPHTSVATAPSSPTSLRNSGAHAHAPTPAAAPQDNEWEDMDATGEININSFQQTLQRDKSAEPDERAFPSGQQEFTPAPRERHMTPMAQPDALHGIAAQARSAGAEQPQQPTSISAQWSSSPPEPSLANQQSSGSMPNAQRPAQISGNWPNAPAPEPSLGGQRSSGHNLSAPPVQSTPEPLARSAPQPNLSLGTSGQSQYPQQQQQPHQPSGQWPSQSQPQPQVQPQRQVQPSGQWSSAQHAQHPTNSSQNQQWQSQQQPQYQQGQQQQARGADVQWPSAQPPSPVNQSTPQPQQQYEPTPNANGSAIPDDFIPETTSASMQYDIHAMKAGNRNKKMLIFFGGLIFVGAIVALVVTIGIDRPVPEIKDPNKIDPSQLEVAPPEPLARVAVDLATTPEGAHVVINGVLVEGTTPGSFELAQGKKNEVIFYHPEHDPFIALFSSPDEIPADAIELPAKSEVDEARRGTIRVESEPLGGLVFHNGEQIGTAPLTLRDLDPDVEHHVLITNKDYYSYAALIRPIAGEEESLRALLEPTSTASRAFTVDLSLETMPRGAQAKANGEFVGVSPALKATDRHQHVEVTFEAANYKPLTRYVETRDVGTLKIRPKLTPIKREKGKVSISLPKGTRDVYIGNNQYDTKSTRKIEMVEGKHTVVLELDDGSRVEADFEVIPGKLTKYKAEVLNKSLRIRKL